MATAAQHRAEIGRINTEVAAQAAKIAELSEILDGKASGGGNSREEKEAAITYDGIGSCFLSYENANGIQTAVLNRQETIPITYYDGGLIVCYKGSANIGLDGIVDGATKIWTSSALLESLMGEETVITSVGIVITGNNVTIS